MPPTLLPASSSTSALLLTPTSPGPPAHPTSPAPTHQHGNMIQFFLIAKKKTTQKPHKVPLNPVNPDAPSNYSPFFPFRSKFLERTVRTQPSSTLTAPSASPPSSWVLVPILTAPGTSAHCLAQTSLLASRPFYLLPGARPVGTTLHLHHQGDGLLSL